MEAKWGIVWKQKLDVHLLKDAQIGELGFRKHNLNTENR